jgi:archaeosine synthase beta-subunit
MSDIPDRPYNDKWVISMRDSKNIVDPHTPYGWLVEKEYTKGGKAEETGIIFLTNRECPFHCLMCDLWKNTTDFSVESGSIPQQIEWALQRMPKVRHIKLYNSGSFFDTRAIPESDYPQIAALLEDFETVIVECHPKLISDKILLFRDMLQPELQIAMGLETVNKEVLMRLNKQMTIDDFRNAADFLLINNIPSRAFILIKPPFMTEDEGIFWAERSIDFAFACGIESCTVIPVRGGNGAMELLKKNGDFNPPEIQSIESVLEYGLSLKSGRVFADTWDLGLFSKCDRCTDLRTQRLIEMNLSQKISNTISCSCIKEIHSPQSPPVGGKGYHKVTQRKDSCL